MPIKKIITVFFLATWVFSLVTFVEGLIFNHRNTVFNSAILFVNLSILIRFGVWKEVKEIEQTILQKLRQ